MLLALFQVPYEILNRKFRAAQRTVDSEAAATRSSINLLRKCIDNGDSSVAATAQALDAVIEKLRSLKRKVGRRVSGGVA